MGVIAELLVLVGANTAPFTEGMAKVNAETAKAGEGAGKFGGLMAGAGLLAAGAVTGVVAFGLEAVKHSEEAGQAAFEMSEKFGLLPTQASAWLSAGSQIGVSNQVVSKGFQLLSKNIENMNLASHTVDQHQFAAAQKGVETASTGLAKAQQHLADATANLHGKTTLTTQEQQHMRDAHAAVAVETEKVKLAQATLSNVMEGQMSPAAKGVAQAFAELGIATKDGHGKLRDLNSLMLESADHFKEMPDGPEKAGLAMKLFGKSGADLIPVLNLGSAGLKDLMEKGRASGAVMSNEQVAAAHKAFLAHKEFDAAVAGLTNQFGNALMPGMTAVMGFLTSQFIPGFEGAVRGVSKLGPWMPLIGAGLALIGGIGMAILIPMFIAWTVATWAQVAALAAQAVAMIAAYWPILLIIVAIAAVVAVVILVVQHWDFLKAKTLEVWSAIQQHVLGIVSWFQGLPGTFLNAAIGIGTAIWQGILAGIRQAGDAIMSAIKELLPGGAGGPVAIALKAAGVPGFALGGMVPGATGAPLFAVVHGGEQVLTPAQQQEHSHPFEDRRIVDRLDQVIDLLALQPAAMSTTAYGRR